MSADSLSWEEKQMTDLITVGKQVQGQVLETIRQSQDAVTDAVSSWADAVRSITPPLPMTSVPLVDKMPKPGDLIANAYDFAEQLLAAQRKFAEDLLEAAAPMLTAKEQPASANESGASTE